MNLMRKRNLVLALVSTAGALGARYAAKRWRGRGSEGKGIGYPPLATPKPVAENIWIVDSGPVRMMGGVALPVRMTVIRLGNGDLVLHSPVGFTPELSGKVAALGRVAHMIAPSLGHWTFLANWQQAYPDAKTWAVPGLRERRQVRQSNIRIDEELGQVAPDAWSGEMEQGLVSSRAFTEAYFYCRNSRTLILTDLIQNAEPARLPIGTAAAMGLAGATQAKTPVHLRLALRLGGASAKQAIEHLLSLNPEKVIFSHGEWFSHQGAERLRAAFDWVTPGAAVRATAL
jgi:hypothetical protein